MPTGRPMGFWTRSLDVDETSNFDHISMLGKCHAAVVTLVIPMAPEVLHSMFIILHCLFVTTFPQRSASLHAHWQSVMSVLSLGSPTNQSQ